ncbi:HBB protein, partial [Indicator maculatus]|nr:HBB protein [Indicator maculatus]
MVHWTAEEKQLITSIWGKVNVAECGAEALASHISSSLPSATSSAPCSPSHLLLPALLHTFSSLLSVISSPPCPHPHHLLLAHHLSCSCSVSPQLLGDILIVVLAAHFSKDFTPEAQAAWQKLVRAVAHALARKYH